MSNPLLARLVVARELLVVDLADRALQNLILALAVEHPTLADLDRPARAPTLRLARRVARLASQLRRDLERYRAAVDAAIAEPDRPIDDLPF